MIAIRISPGELCDRISILKIKSERITEAEKLAHVHDELDDLFRIFTRNIPSSDDIVRLCNELRQVNEALWGIENDLRECERTQVFDQRFIALARSVYRTNDQRSRLKREINVLLKSTRVEEKSYQKY